MTGHLHHLNLPGWETVATTVLASEIRVDARYTVEPSKCPGCAGRLVRKGRYERKHGIVDIPHVGRAVIINLVESGRYICTACRKTTVQPLPDVDDAMAMTRRARQMIEDASLRRTAVDLAEEYGVSSTTVCDIHDKLVDDLERGHWIRTPWLLGIDEKTIGGKRRAVFVDLGRPASRLIDMTPDNSQATVARWLADLPEPFRVEVVVMDACDKYRSAVRQALPGATIVLDRFHVQRAAAPAQRVVASRKAWRRLTKIWDLPDPLAAAAAFDQWEGSLAPEERPPFAMFLRIWHAWRSELLAYFERRETNGGTENRNKRIKLVTMQAPNSSFASIRAAALHGHLRPSRDLVRCDFCRALCRDGTLEMVDVAANDGSDLSHAAPEHIRWKLACQRCAPEPAPRPSPLSIWLKPKSCPWPSMAAAWGSAAAKALHEGEGLLGGVDTSEAIGRLRRR